MQLALISVICRQHCRIVDINHCIGTLFTVPDEEKKGKKELLEVMKEIIQDQGHGQDNQDTINVAIDDAISRADNDEDVDMADLVEKFTEVRL